MNLCLGKRKLSIQACVYQIPPGQWLTKTFLGVFSNNRNISEKRFRMCVSEKEIYDSGFWKDITGAQPGSFWVRGGFLE